MPQKYYPRTAAGTGETLGLSVTMDVNVTDYYCSSTSGVGFKMILHSPAEMPHVREIGTLLAAGMETKIRIRTEKYEAAPNIKSINKKYRQCYFEEEAKLQYYAQYNRRNCEYECMAKVMQRECDCIAHYLPFVVNPIRICGLRDAVCVDAVRRNILNKTSMNLDCQEQCWPSCFDVIYYMDLFTTPISHAGFDIANEEIKKLSDAYVQRNIAVAHFYFQETTFRSTRQTEFVGMTDFLCKYKRICLDMFMN